MHHYLTDKQLPHAACQSVLQHRHRHSQSLTFGIQGQKDLGFLMNPGEGAISAVALYVPPEVDAPTHLFSGGADGTLAVWSAGRSWDCLRVNVYHMQSRTCCMMLVGCRATKFEKAYLLIKR